MCCILPFASLITCCTGRIGFIILNAILIAVGIALIACGISGVSQFTNLSIVVHGVTTLPYFTTCVGIVLIIVGAVAIYASIAKSKTILLIYAGGLGILVFLSIVYIPVALKKIDALEPNEVVKMMKDSIKEYGTNSEVTQTIDKIHTMNKCCGADGFKDFPEDKIPKSCLTNDGKPFGRGCGSILSEQFRYLSWWLFFIVIMTLTLLVWAAVCVGCMLLCSC